MIEADLKSSNLAHMSWAATDSTGDTGVLRIRFNNGLEYEYAEVPREIAQALLDAESAGRYFAQNIRPRFSTTKLEVTSEVS